MTDLPYGLQKWLYRLAVAAIIWTLLFPMLSDHWWTRTYPDFVRSSALSADQMRSVGRAVAQYEQETGERPARLEDAVKAGDLDACNLFDEDEDVPEIDAATGRFAENPHVLYFPAVRKDDPGDLVLLCTLLLRERDDAFRVIYNDGKYAELTRRQLIQALQRTYTYLGAKIQGMPVPQTATRPAVTNTR